MRENKLTVKKQLYLQSIPWLFFLIVVAIGKVDWVSESVNIVLTVVMAIVIIYFFVLGLKKKETIDESAKSILAKVDGICLHTIIYSLIIFNFTISPNNNNNVVTTLIPVKFIGLFLVIVAYLVLLLRAILFGYYDKRGI
ncbi:hypothetical protein SAMN02745163_00406 [Clostridium cavendishii DSM 21758]|uniref:Uncharacterized protein n=1 Tax=Clostridium cavendishii DSM 21758 TaxID=1121302 RepID=A0A1M6BNT4_9CLOT|nr:hypothetical protein [Clostridium cavendishii]SHI50208.1 hypothetical protein SAMN02745163_00406 [Clostridium cavendishii DSM 21758]